MLNLKKIGKKITDLRKDNNMKQNELADTLYVTHQAVSKWENGRSIPSIEMLYDLTKLFNVSIDYILDDTNIKSDDYESLFKNYPRKVVISRFLETNDLNNEVDKIFYLLKPEERKHILDHIISKRVKINVENIWHILSKKERWYILNLAISKKFKFDISRIYNKSNDLERNLIQTHYNIMRTSNFNSLTTKEKKNEKKENKQ